VDGLDQGGWESVHSQLFDELLPGYLVEGFFQVYEVQKGFDPIPVPDPGLSVCLFYIPGLLDDLGQVDEVVLTRPAGYKASLVGVEEFLGVNLFPHFLEDAQLEEFGDRGGDGYGPHLS